MVSCIAVILLLLCTHWKHIGTVSTDLLIIFQWRVGPSLICLGIIHTNILQECVASFFIVEATLKMEAAHSSEISLIVCWRRTITFMFTGVKTSNLRFMWIFVLEICSKCSAHLIMVCICPLWVQTHMKCKCNLKHFLYTCWLYRKFVD